MDGTLGSKTALMTDGTGVEITTREELADIVRRAADARWPVAVHAIGDRANQNALDAFEETRDAWQPLGLRHRIEHTQCLRPEDVGRFAELGLTASVQFSHAPSDEELAHRFWADRLDGTYSFRSLLDAGTRLINGSDAPIEELDPWGGIVAGVLRALARGPARDGRGGADRVDGRARVADRRRAPAREAPARVSRRPRRPRPRPVRDPGGGASRGAGGRDDGRRPLDAQPAALA